jgi:xanthine dehydrogenase accessory factor
MSFFQRLQKIEEDLESVALCIIVSAKGSTPRRAGSKMLVFPDGHFEGTIGGGEFESRVREAAKEALADGKPRLVSYSMTDPAKGDVGVCGGQMEVYVEPIFPQPTILIIGGGHVGKAVVELGHWMGYRLVVCDDRPEFATPEQIPQADEHHQIPLDQVTQKVKVHSHTFVLLTTRNVEVDAKALPPLLETPAAYIGVIGSKRRWETTCKMLQEQGITKKQIERIVSPIGLELNAETPEEIAVSILAEITMLRYGGSGGRMSKKK